LPYEGIKDAAGKKAKKLTREDFDQEFKKHQAKSRAGTEKKFGGHGLLLDTGELKAGNEEELKKATRLHTATHLLHAALRKILGLEVRQAGSDITAERLRFDFTFPRKMTPEEIKQVEDLVNDVVIKDYQVTKKEMSYEDAIKSGALAFFKLKYPDRVSIYTIGPESVEGQPFSKELCGGPHVTHTAEIGHFKITKEESIAADTRRIRAIVE
jgi:alanyl-tRNA synthetase